MAARYAAVAMLLLAAAPAGTRAAEPLPRALTADGKGNFVDSDGKTVLLVGANIVVKGPPFIPDATGDDACGEAPNCDDMHTCNTTCTTFNKHDAKLLKDQGYNFIRLGTPWAGGQPETGDKLDPKFEKTLQAILDVCKEAGIYAVLDLHQDAVATANCGEGMPTWVSKLAVPDLIGQPLAPVEAAVEGGDLPKDWPMLPDGSCGANDTETWAEHAGDTDYNIKNKCCRQLNGGSWGALGYSTSAQRTMAYLLDETGDGPEHYAKYVELLVKAVAKHPHAVGIETMNEPPVAPVDLFPSNTTGLFKLYKRIYERVRKVSKDMSLSVQHPGQIVPDSEEITTVGLTDELKDWLKDEDTTGLFYTWHCYGCKMTEDIEAATTFSNEYGGMPQLLTEYPPFDCDITAAAAKAGIGSSWWHYADYCDTCDNCIPVEEGKSWGACITGWGWGYANRTDAFAARADCMECAVPWKDDADCPKPPPPPPPTAL